jgi:hypothetical protein
MRGAMAHQRKLLAAMQNLKKASENVADLSFLWRGALQFHLVILLFQLYSSNAARRVWWLSFIHST